MAYKLPTWPPVLVSKGCCDKFQSGKGTEHDVSSFAALKAKAPSALHEITPDLGRNVTAERDQLESKDHSTW